MLTQTEIENTRYELNENVKRLAYSREKILSDTQLSDKELNAVLTMSGANPTHVWLLRDYLEDKLIEEKRPIYPWSRLADHSANRWFSYDTPWRTK